MEELFSWVNGQRVRVVPAGTQVVLADIEDGDNPNVSHDAAGRTRVSQITTLGDYKILNSDDVLTMQVVGNGSGTFSNNLYNMHVESGQYLIRQSRKFHPYFSGKGQIVENTFDNFEVQPGIIKRVGYFSSNAVAPYTGTFDGYFLESDGINSTYVLRVFRSGVEVINVPWTQWDKYEEIQDYDFRTFTVFFSEFLWLGGAALNLYLVKGKKFIKVHSLEYAGVYQDVFIKSPNQPIRYEIRGISGAGDFRYVCSQVATEGSIEESGKSRFVYTGTTGTTVSTIDTTYPLKAIRKQSAKRDNSIELLDVSVFVTTTNDNLLWTIQINPTMSAPLTYSNVLNSAAQDASGNGTITVTSPGTIVAGGVITSNSLLPTDILKRNFLSYLGGTIANVMDEYVLCVTPLTSNILVYGGISYKEY